MIITTVELSSHGVIIQQPDPHDLEHRVMFFFLIQSPFVRYYKLLSKLCFVYKLIVCVHFVLGEYNLSHNVKLNKVFNYIFFLLKKNVFSYVVIYK